MAVGSEVNPSEMSMPRPRISHQSAEPLTVAEFGRRLGVLVGRVLAEEMLGAARGARSVLCRRQNRRSNS